MSALSPCLGCEERHLHCHSECEKYKAYKAILEEVKADARKRNEEYMFNYELKREVMKRYDRRKKGDGK